MLQPPPTSPHHATETMVSYVSTISSSHQSMSGTALTTPDLGSPTKSKATLEPLLQVMERVEERSTLETESAVDEGRYPEQSPKNMAGIGLRGTGGLRVRDVATRWEQMGDGQQSIAATPTDRRPLPIPRSQTRSTSPLRLPQQRSTTVSSDGSASTIRPIEDVHRLPTPSEAFFTPLSFPSPSVSTPTTPVGATPSRDLKAEETTPVRPALVRGKGSTKQMIQKWEGIPGPSTANVPQSMPRPQPTTPRSARGALSKANLDKPLPIPKDSDGTPLPSPKRLFTPAGTSHRTPPRTAPARINANQHLTTPTRSSRKRPDTLAPSPSRTNNSGSSYSPSNEKRQKLSPLKDVLNFFGARKGKSGGKGKEKERDYGDLGMNQGPGRFGVVLRDRMGSAEMRTSPDSRPPIRSSPIMYLIPTPCSSVSQWDAWLPSWAALSTSILAITYCPVFPTPRAGTADTARRCSGSSFLSGSKGVPFGNIPPPNPGAMPDVKLLMGECQEVRSLRKDECKERGIPPAPDGVGAEVIEMLWRDGSKRYVAVEGVSGRNDWIVAIRGILRKSSTDLPILPPLTPIHSPFGSMSSPLRFPSPTTRPPRESLPTQSPQTIEDGGFSSLPPIQKVGDTWVADGPLATGNSDVGASRPKRRLVEVDHDDELRESVRGMFPASAIPNLDGPPTPTRAARTIDRSTSERILAWQSPQPTERGLSIFARARGGEPPAEDEVPYRRAVVQEPVAQETLSVVPRSDTMSSFDSNDLNPSRSASQVKRAPSSALSVGETPKQRRYGPGSQNSRGGEAGEAAGSGSASGRVKNVMAVWEARSSASSTVNQDVFSTTASQVSRVTFPTPIRSVEGLRIRSARGTPSPVPSRQMAVSPRPEILAFSNVPGPSRLPRAPSAAAAAAPAPLPTIPSQSSMAPSANEPSADNTETTLVASDAEGSGEVQAAGSAGTAGVGASARALSPVGQPVLGEQQNGPRLGEPVSSEALDDLMAGMQPASPPVRPPSRVMSPSVRSVRGVGSVARDFENQRTVGEDRRQREQVSFPRPSVQGSSPGMASGAGVRGALERGLERDSTVRGAAWSARAASPFAEQPPPRSSSIPPSQSDITKVLEHLELLLTRTSALTDPETAPYPKALDQKLRALHEDLVIVKSTAQTIQQDNDTRDRLERRLSGVSGTQVGAGGRARSRRGSNATAVGAANVPPEQAPRTFMAAGVPAPSRPMVLTMPQPLAPPSAGPAPGQQMGDGEKMPELHRKLDYLTKLYEEFLDKQKVAEGSRSLDVAVSDGEDDELAVPPVGAKRPPNKRRSSSLGRISSVLRRKSVSFDKAAKTESAPAPTIAAAVKGQSPLKRKAVPSEEEKKAEEEEVAGKEVAEIMGEKENEVKPLKQAEVHVLDNVTPITDAKPVTQPLLAATQPTPDSKSNLEDKPIVASTPAPPAPVPTTTTLVIPDEIKGQLQSAVAMLGVLHADRGAEDVKQDSILKHLTELGTWLEGLSKNNAKEINTVHKRLDILVGPEPAAGETVPSTPPGGLPALVADAHSMLVEQKRRQEAEGFTGQRLDELVRMMGLDSERAATHETLLQQVLGMVAESRSHNENLLRGLATDLLGEIRGEKMRFLESMQEATKMNIQMHVEEFKRLLSVEVNKSMSELGRVREEKRALEQQISDLFALKAKHGLAPRALPTPGAAPAPSPAHR
ncbi:hypothetical protein IAT38_001817 [Cryptococcus sp. DSM 104549]